MSCILFNFRATPAWRIAKSTFTSALAVCNSRAAMAKKWICLVLLSALFLAGCVTTVTNLTSTTQPRNPNNLYLIEYQWDTTQQTIKATSVKPYVVVGFDTYEMKKTLRLTNRWEVLVPIPPDKNVIDYHFKVEYEYARFGKPGVASKSSPEHKLYIK